jgi:hypothetical protein
MNNITFSFSLDIESDADIIRWLNSLPRGRKSAAIREAIRVGLRTDGPGNVERKLDAILEKLDQGVTIGGNSNTPTAEPERAASALDRLGI